ncbi:MAG: hypothetical protein Kow0089_24870 [Desulfobulbaceae bacterium]
MRLQVKVLIVLLAVMTLLGMLSLTFYLRVIEPSFLAIEEKDAYRDMQRVVFAIKNELQHLNSLNHDWAAWDATYEFMATRSDEYVEENLPVSSFTDNSLNLIHFYDPDGNLVWGEARDLETEELIAIDGFTGDRLPKNHPLLRHDFNRPDLDEVSVKGIWMTKQGPLLISSRPILTNENEGPPRGSLFMGRFFDAAGVERLARQTGVSFRVVPPEEAAEEPLRSRLATLGPDAPYLLDLVNDNQLRVVASIPFLNGGPGLVLEMEKEREIHERNHEVLNYTIFSIFLSIAGAVLILIVMLQKIVISPLNELTRHAVDIGRRRDFSVTFNPRANDEIGQLAREFGTMMQRLHEAKHSLQEQSFRLGMAELSAGVLHNARNSLHGLVSEVERARKSCERVPRREMEQAGREMSAAEDAGRVRELAGFLVEANTALLQFVDRVAKHLDATLSRIRETERILTSFEKWAYGGRPSEPVAVLPLVEESFGFLESGLRERLSLHINHEDGDPARMMANRVILVQILLNLFANAAESIARQGTGKGELRVEICERQSEKGSVVRVSVCDNGAGIDGAVLPHVFERGFTTKNEGHRGVGLHWCATAAETMGGRLWVESEGRGRGACFHLELPAEPPVEE